MLHWARLHSVTAMLRWAVLQQRHSEQCGVDPLIGGFHSNKIVGRALSNQPTSKFKVSKVKECVSRFDKRPRRSSCIYSTLSKAFTMISKVFQAGDDGSAFYPRVLPSTKSHFQIISSHRHLHLPYHHSLPPSKTDTSLTAYHGDFPRSDCTNILVEIWGEYFSGILSRAIVRNQLNVARV